MSADSAVAEVLRLSKLPLAARTMALPEALEVTEPFVSSVRAPFWASTVTAPV